MVASSGPMYFKFITFHYSNCCIFRVKTIRNNNEIDRNKTARYKVTPRQVTPLQMASTYDRKSFRKTPTDISSTRLRICVPGSYAPGINVNQKSKLSKMEENSRIRP